MKRQSILPIILVLLLSLSTGCKRTAEEQPTARGMTHLSGLEVSGDETDEFVVNQTGTGDIIEFRDAGTPVWRLADGGGVTQTGTFQYGADTLYPVGYASSGQQMVYGTSTITGTATAVHGLTTVTFALSVLGEDPTSGAGDCAHATLTVSANVVTLKTWQDDFVTAATETSCDVHWLVIGAP